MIRRMTDRLPSIDEARAMVLARVAAPAPQDVPVARALDRVLAHDVVAAGDVPPWPNSAVDGFAVRPGPAGRTLRIVGESRAGAPAGVAVGDGEAIRISTGAVLPAGAGAVAMVEDCEEAPDGTVTVRAQAPDGANVRGAGEDVLAGTRVLRRGAILGPAELGVAVGAGAATVACGPRPRVAVLSTGDELVPPGAALGPGQIHDSNAIALAALAERAGAEVVLVGHVADTRDETERVVASALERADVLVCTGGVSVGPHDHVKPALVAQGVDEVFWRVALRPGKPTWFGTRGSQLVLGLPGNPVSAMVTFLLFARPALRALQGADPQVPRTRAVLTQPVRRHAGRDECVRVRLDGGQASPTGAQGSHRLTSMLGADGFAIVTRGTGEAAAGDEVEVELLP
jgi:molybdopterin molybdotransferase